MSAKFLFSFSFLLIVSTSFSQEPPVIDTVLVDSLSAEKGLFQQEDEILDWCETDPRFPGGSDALLKYVQQNLEYPRASPHFQGRVYVEFVVEKSGKVSGERMLKGMGSEYDQQVLEMIRKMPEWFPGMKVGEAKSYKFILPIQFY